jgi:hypothetical protein
MYSTALLRMTPLDNGEKLVDEFERRQAERHIDREAERKRLLAEDSQEDR